MYAQVIVNNTSHNVDKPFHYRIPENMLGGVKIGTRVAVPFGSGNKLLEGYVVEISQDYPEGLEKVKEIVRVIDRVPIFSEELIALGRWMQREYLSTWAEALQCIMPSKVKKKGIKYIKLGKQLDQNHPDREKYLPIYEAIKNAGGKVKYETAREIAKAKGKESHLDRLVEQGYLVQEYLLKSSVSKKYRCWARLVSEGERAQPPKNAHRMKAVMEYLAGIDEMELPCSSVIEETGCSMSTLRAMEKRGILKLYDKRVERTPQLQKGLVEDRVERLTKHQIQAIDEIKKMYGEGIREILLHGVTGSGKTEIYLNLIGETVRQGKKAIVLVPEISLTPQMVEWYTKRFGGRAALFHSKLSPGERYDQWEGIRRGDYDVAIGARSAVFAPFENIGLIIVDEEHEHTYKSEHSPKYVTRDVARKRCSYYDGLLVLGSATPSVETYHRAQKGEIGIVELNERVGGSTLPRVEVVDMRKELKEGNRSIFSRKLKEEIEDTLAKNQQIILLLNRRGFSTYLCCRDCGDVVKCSNCDITLTYHLNENRLTCHYCGHTRALPRKCEKCGSKRIKYMGSGTEKLEKEVEENFPGARVLRMDVDTTRKKGSHFNILMAFKKHEGDILLGTQMIAKGLDFPGVTLVGVILADFTLNLPDFRASEKTFQLLTQVSGRAGRGDIPGKVIVQTYSPEHYSIIASRHHDYKEFYKDEIAIRERFGYPPFSRLMNIIISGEDYKEVAEASQRFYEGIREKLKRYEGSAFEIFGPCPALHAKIKGKYRWQIIIKSTGMEIIKEEIKNIWLGTMRTDYKGVNIILDVDPYNLM